MNESFPSIRAKPRIDGKKRTFVPMSTQPNNPLHGVTLEAMLLYLHKELGGWRQIGFRIPVNCFLIDPSLKSSLKFLRKTPWARAKVEELYLEVKSQDSGAKSQD